MSLSRRLAWRSPASIPVRRNSFLESCPVSATRVFSRSLLPSPVLISSNLVRVEAELVEPAQAVGDPVALLLGFQDLLAGQLLPQRLVPAPELLGDLQRLHVGREQLARLQVEQLAVEPLDGEFHVPLPLPVGQLRMLLAGLRVDQVRLQRARVVPEQGVGQRAVAPEKARQVQPDQQLDQRVEQPVGRLQAPGVGEDGPVGGRIAEEPGNQDRVLVAVSGTVPVDRDADHLHGRDAELGQRPEQPVFAPRQPLAQLLEGVQGVVVVDETDHVPGDAPLPDLDQPLVPPLRERFGPRQREQAGRVVGGRSEDEPHRRPGHATSRAGREPCWPR